MRHLDHLVGIVQSEAKRAAAVEDALEAFRQATARETTEHDGRLRLLEKGCETCGKEAA